ncbi:MAG: N-acetylmuramoyl-L-alanine amidase [Spirochaetes bacterium]|nr:N-acetylmuramoyl-L-alanine amidase [Spirochaetota bacterium]
MPDIWQPGDAPHPIAPGTAWLPVRRWEDDEYLAGRLPLLEDPEGVVLHCGATDGDLARYTTHEPAERDVSYHLVIDRRRRQVIQTVPLTHRAWHAGRWNGWYGIALLGPYELDPRPDWERDALRAVLIMLAEARPSVRYVCRHSEQPGAGRRDPGPGVKADWLEGTGLRWGLPG